MTIIAQEIITEIENLPVEKQQEVLKFVKSLQPSKSEEKSETAQKEPRPSLKGLWADLDIDISDEDIHELRREMWANFPREILVKP